MGYFLHVILRLLNRCFFFVTSGKLLTLLSLTVFPMPSQDSNVKVSNTRPGTEAALNRRWLFFSVYLLLLPGPPLFLLAGVYNCAPKNWPGPSSFHRNDHCAELPLETEPDVAQSILP